ncbi:hypothetical protein EJP82_20860 [Paenibacillus anaericanus]|uniref:Uncharacterized protein n=1 Tax=Paenibacillus anaericanus TaxID=170367 RepID=A0A3S1DN41_9BACL|nr:hypothetical protein [Paenibacillus anaericanus]RUT43268.1 hypothetical protein EJP82_20860 [Paenibacillus anaericanus]
MTDYQKKALNAQIIAIDHGNGYVKGYTSEKKLLLPNQFIRKDLLLSKPYFDLDEYTSIKFENETYFWGKNICMELNPISTFSLHDRYIQKPYKLLSEFTLAEMAEDHNELIVVTGVPSDQIRTREVGDLKKVFEGMHEMKVNGCKKFIEVKDVYILTQPLGTFLYIYLDDEGNIVDPDIEEEHVGIIDVGAGTFNLDGIHRMKAVYEDRDTFAEGLFKVYRRISDYINKEYPEAKATPKLVELQFLGDNLESYRVSKRVSIDIKKIKDIVFNEYIDDIIPKINQLWTRRSKFDRILLTGGGATPLAPYLLNWERDIEVPNVENCQLTNAIGFYRFGVAKVNNRIE